MGIIDANLGRILGHEPPEARTPRLAARWGADMRMTWSEPEASQATLTEQQRTAKLAELDGLIDALHADLDSVPNARWETPYARDRHRLLIAYTQKRHLLSL